MRILYLNFRCRFFLIAFAVLLGVGVLDGFSAKVVLRIRSGNPIDKPQKVRIKSKLPDRITTNDIIDLGGLDLGYDVKNDAYYVHTEVELGAQQVKIYDVVLDDIWVVSEDRLRSMVSRAGKLLEMLKETDYYGNATLLQSDISKSADAILELQAKNAISEGVTPIQHIRTYEINLRDLERVQKDVGRIENFVLASGQDPGSLIGVAQDESNPRTIHIRPEDYREVVFQISVKNSSPNEVRKIDIRRDLPSEVYADDVLDAGDLDVGRDSRRNITYVFKKNVKLAPNQALNYEIRIRDKWNINGPKIDSLRSRISNVAGRLGEKEQYGSIEENLDKLLSEINEIRNEEGPDKLGSEYVAFYRNQTKRLALLEKGIYRIEEALRVIDKKSKLGFDPQPPSEKTTWLIIYIIMAFLGFISLVFFFRWMGKGKDEKVVDSE